MTVCDRNIGDSIANDSACNECPIKSDLTWNHSPTEITKHHPQFNRQKIDQDEPFKLDEKTRVCYMKCLNGYFSKYPSHYAKTSETSWMTCQLVTCKTAIWPVLYLYCSSCWSAKDMLENHYRWDGRPTYNWEKIKDADPTTPWFHGMTAIGDHQCKLNCVNNTWSNYPRSNHWKLPYAADPTQQRCTSDNCKDWDSDAVQTIDTILDTWVTDRGSASAAEIVELMNDSPINFELSYPETSSKTKRFTLKKLTLKANGGFLVNAEFMDPVDATVFDIRKETGWSNDRICLDFSASAQKNFEMAYNATMVQFDFTTANFVQDSGNLFILINQGCHLTSKLENPDNEAQNIHECKCFMPRTISNPPEYKIQDSKTKFIHLPVTIDEFVYRDLPDRSENFYRSEPSWVGVRGGECVCPDGDRHQIADTGDSSCGTIACYKGIWDGSCTAGGGKSHMAVDCRYNFELKIKSGSMHVDLHERLGFYVSSDKLLNGKIYYFNTKQFIGHNGRTWVFDTPANLDHYLASQPIYFKGTYDSRSNPHGITLDGVTFPEFDIIRAAATTDTATYEIHKNEAGKIVPTLNVTTTLTIPDWDSYMSTPTPNDKMFSHISLAITGKAFIGILVDPHKESLILFGILKPELRHILGMYMLEDNSKTYGYFVGIEYPKDPIDKFLFKLSGFIHPNTWVFNNKRNGSHIFDWPSSPAFAPPKPITNKTCTACWNKADMAD
jgi:hypothetical protein